MTKAEADTMRFLQPLVFTRDFFVFLKGEKVWYLGEGNSGGTMRVETDLMDSTPAYVPYDAVAQFVKNPQISNTVG